jgi:hypothetical protein
MSPLRLTGSTSGFSQLDAPAIAGDQTFTLPSTGGTLDRLNRAGNILQVVNATYSTEATSTSSAFADTGLTATITPTSSSSKVLVIVSQAGCHKGLSDTSLQLKLLRDATDVAWIERAGAQDGSSGTNNIGSCSICYLDSPSTTSATTYKTQFASQVNTSRVRVQISASGIAPVSTITLMEIAA